MYDFCGSKWSEDIQRSIGPTRGWSKAHTCVNRTLTRGLRLRREDVEITQSQTKIENKRSEERRLASLSIEEPKEQIHLRSTLCNSLHQKIKLYRRHQNRTSNGNGKYLEMWLSPPHLMKVLDRHLQNKTKFKAVVIQQVQCWIYSIRWFLGSLIILYFGINFFSFSRLVKAFW